MEGTGPGGQGLGCTAGLLDGFLEGSQIRRRLVLQLFGQDLQFSLEAVRLLPVSVHLRLPQRFFGQGIVSSYKSMLVWERRLL